MRCGIAIVALLMVGCQGMPQQQSDAQRQAEERRARDEAARADRQRVDRHCESLFRDAGLDPIRTKLGIARDGDSTFEMLLDNTKATDAEKAALIVWAKRKEECKNELVAHFRRFSPPVYPEHPTIYEAGFTRFQFLIADLYNGVLTYAEFSRKRKELNADFNAKMTELRQLYAQRSAEARHRAAQLANDARRAAALEEQAANQRYQIQMQQLEALRPRFPRSTTCTTYYNMTTCD